VAQRPSKSQATGARLAERIKSARTEVGLSLRALGRRTGFSASFLSQLELGQVSPSLASLDKIAETLGLTLSELLSDAPATEEAVVVRHSGGDLRSDWSKASLRPLTPPDDVLECVLIRLDRGGRSGTTPAGQPVRRCAFCIRGKIRVHLDHQLHLLGAGDSLFFSRPYMVSWENAGQRAAELLLVTVLSR
jgi:XRE family transcriptional regulator, regulator of sulfur utilization